MYVQPTPPPPRVPDRMQARAAEMAAMGLNINQFGVPLAEGFAFGGKIKKRKKRK